MEDDEIRNDMSNAVTYTDIDSTIIAHAEFNVDLTSESTMDDISTNTTPDNPLLGEILDFYDCYDLMPLASRIIWLSSVKEAIGRIPDDIDVDYDEIRYLVLLQEEQNKKLAYENYRMRQDNKKTQNSSAADMNQMIHSG
jgi:hypothetical protein